MHVCWLIAPIKPDVDAEYLIFQLSFIINILQIYLNKIFAISTAHFLMDSFTEKYTV